MSLQVAGFQVLSTSALSLILNRRDTGLSPTSRPTPTKGTGCRLGKRGDRETRWRSVHWIQGYPVLRFVHCTWVSVFPFTW